MRIAFSTLGLPGASATEAVDIAARHGFRGVELRADRNEPVHVDMSHATEAVSAAADADVRLLSVASYVKVADPLASDDEIVAALEAHAQLAVRLEARYVRVFPGGARPYATPEDDVRAGRRLAAAVRRVEGMDVRFALETHDSHNRGRDVRRVLDQPGCSEVAAIWDVLHTWLGGEPAAETVDLLWGRLAYVQVKDVVSRTDLTPRALGEGALPLAAVRAALLEAGFGGWVSWEYERAWFPDAPALETLASGARDWLSLLA